MTTKEIASRLIELCRKGEFDVAQKELYGEDVISIEPEKSEMYDKETKGKDAVYNKIEKFMASVEETYKIEVSEPLVAGNSFSVTMGMDVKMKGMDRMNMSELCIYKVKDGKVISEEFLV